MRKFPACLLLPLAAALAGCSVPEAARGPQVQAPSGPGAAIVFEKRTFKLVRIPDPELEAALEGLLTASYEAAIKDHAGDNPMDIGFTYSLAPKGAVYPFSEIEVSCILQEKYANRRGPELCGYFFTQLDGKIRKAVAGRQ